VTPIPTSLARALIESLRSETVVENNVALELLDLRPVGFEEAVRLALQDVRTRSVETLWTSATSVVDSQRVDASHLRTDEQVVEADVPAPVLFAVVSSIGGENGWHFANWLWKLRGFIDKQFGGVGLRRGRRHPTELRVGEALDFWRVEEYEEGRRLLLRAEMKVWGQAWLEFKVEPLTPQRSRLVQTARYYLKGLSGYLYWYGILPLHALVFRGMARAIARRAEQQKLV
jgi:hypothetical protein